MTSDAAPAGMAEIKGLLRAAQALCDYVGLTDVAPAPDLSHVRYLLRDLHNQINAGRPLQADVDAEVENILAMSEDEILAAATPLDLGLARLMRSQARIVQRAVDAKQRAEKAEARIAELERQNADLQGANNLYLERAREAEAHLAGRPAPINRYNFARKLKALATAESSWEVVADKVLALLAAPQPAPGDEAAQPQAGPDALREAAERLLATANGRDGRDFRIVEVKRVERIPITFEDPTGAA